MIPYTLEFTKDRFKFSAAHFTLFSATEAERLHGHNYRVFIKVVLPHIEYSTGISAPFHSLKEDIEKICAKLDEYTLIPKHSPFLEIERTSTNININFNSKKYSLPTEDVCLLPLVNITSELLAHYIHTEIYLIWSKKYNALNLEVGIQESDGQAVYYAGETV